MCETVGPEILGAARLLRRPVTSRSRNPKLFCVFADSQNAKGRISALWPPPCLPSLKFQFPGLSRQILSEAVMFFFTDDLETCLFVNVSRCVQNALRP